MSDAVFCLQRATSGGGIFVRTNEEGLSVLDVFPKRKLALRFCKLNGVDLSSIRYQKIPMDKFTTHLPTMSLHLGVDVLQFGERLFPLSDQGIKYISSQDEDQGDVWQIVLGQLGEPGLWFAIGIWWDNASRGNILDINEDFIDTYLPDEVVNHILALRERIQQFQQVLPGSPEMSDPKEVQDATV
jgi:hypothetical protein